MWGGKRTKEEERGSKGDVFSEGSERREAKTRTRKKRERDGEK